MAKAKGKKKTKKTSGRKKTRKKSPATMNPIVAVAISLAVLGLVAFLV